MSTEYHHGVRVFEVNEGGATIRVVSTAIIGIVATAPAADAEAFPLNTPVLLTNPGGSVGKAGATGTLAQALKAISQQAQALTIVVRVEPGADAAATTTNVIGTTTAGGQKTGLQALLAAQGQLGVKPRIIGAPGLDTEAVAVEIGVVAEQLRGFGYVAARKADGMAYATSKEEATTYRAKFGKRELMVIWPNFLAWNIETNEPDAVPATAYALGLRAKIDQQIGWHKTLSNIVVNGPQGITADVFFDLQSPSSDTTYLNALEVTTIVNRSGYRFWGNRTTEAQGGKFFFENYTRTAQVLADTMAEAHFTFVDKPMHPSLVKDMLANINAKGRDLVTGGYLIGFEAFLNPDLNPKEELAQGRLRISYRYTPVPPLEDLGFNQTITDDFLANFAAAVQAA
ncbi:phage tail sheath subtilisin-like domain-containing protein [Variovorax sp. CY25R-8]|uniref:phage tail sheath subtilisin-like domain-containing protein n=1 Tax=Variovorax sp. CY25R-8 TaxID=2855501 RepID=UPI0021BB5B97|nr:phage tail sheath subtilisin-like domain-containing protein [Variovorax sp. CY25R-8]MCT8178127.1 phage tail sheath subtilisin-like domain-containing protein [Variovorax sp. CY25R-8]